MLRLQVVHVSVGLSSSRVPLHGPLRRLAHPADFARHLLVSEARHGPRARAGPFDGGGSVLVRRHGLPFERPGAGAASLAAQMTVGAFGSGGGHVNAEFVHPAHDGSGLDLLGGPGQPRALNRLPFARLEDAEPPLLANSAKWSGGGESVRDLTAATIG